MNISDVRPLKYKHMRIFLILARAHLGHCWCDQGVIKTLAKQTVQLCILFFCNASVNWGVCIFYLHCIENVVLINLHLQLFKCCTCPVQNSVKSTFFMFFKSSDGNRHSFLTSYIYFSRLHCVLHAHTSSCNSYYFSVFGLLMFWC